MISRLCALFIVGTAPWKPCCVSSAFSRTVANTLTSHQLTLFARRGRASLIMKSGQLSANQWRNPSSPMIPTTPSVSNDLYGYSRVWRLRRLLVGRINSPKPETLFGTAPRRFRVKFTLIVGFPDFHSCTDSFILGARVLLPSAAFPFIRISLAPAPSRYFASSEEEAANRSSASPRK